jgi:hypothetical protein
MSGCGETRVPVYPVSGKVNYQGRPPVGAQVVLQPLKGADPESVLPMGQVRQDGSFTITSYDPDDGAPEGDYVAIIRWYKFDKDRGGPGPNVIPAAYGSAKSSPIKVSVNTAPTNIPPITIK